MDRQQLSSWEHHNKDPPAAVAAGLYEACSGAVVLAMGEPDLDVGVVSAAIARVGHPHGAAATWVGQRERSVPLGTGAPPPRGPGHGVTGPRGQQPGRPTARGSRSSLTGAG